MIFTGSIARSAKRPYLNYSEADFHVFRHDGVKFGNWHGEGPLLRAKFHPHRCNDKVTGPPKVKFLLRFDQNVEYKRPAGVYPLRDFHKICRVCTSFQGALGVKIGLDLLKGVKFGMEEGTEGPLLHAKFHPHRCNVSPLGGEKPQNWPLSKLNTGRFVLRAMLPVTNKDYSWW